jgi:cytochrome c-type biogenesis protein CcmF
VSMGDSLGNDTWSVRLQYKPMVRFIWMGAFIIAFGGFVAVFDRRYRQRVTADARSPAAAEASTI